ncbi:MAG: Ig-like domain-containing protein, partial [Ilumatobacteraceae bacterium]
IPPAACTQPLDQASTARPLGAGCEIGSVEIVTAGLAAVDDFVTVPAGRRVPTVIDVLANDDDGGGRLRPATLHIVQRPRHGTAVALRGHILYVPDKRFVGTDSLTYRVCATRARNRHRVDCDTAVVTITVR